MQTLMDSPRCWRCHWDTTTSDPSPRLPSTISPISRSSTLITTISGTWHQGSTYLQWAPLCIRHFLVTGSSTSWTSCAHLTWATTSCCWWMRRCWRTSEVSRASAAAAVVWPTSEQVSLEALRLLEYSELIYLCWAGFSLRFLRQLDLRDNNIESLDDVEPHIVRSLATLNLSGNKISKVRIFWRQCAFDLFLLNNLNWKMPKSIYFVCVKYFHFSIGLHISPLLPLQVGKLDFLQVEELDLSGNRIVEMTGNDQ